jgi:hypothetical protein
MHAATGSWCVTLPLLHGPMPPLILLSPLLPALQVRVSPLKDDHGRPAFLLLTPKAIFRSPPSAPPSVPALLTAPSVPSQPLASPHQYASHTHGQMLCPPGQLASYAAAHVGAPCSGAAPLHQQQQTHMANYNM